MNKLTLATGNNSMPRQPLLIKADEAALLAGISTRTLWRLVSAGHFPAPVRLGGNTRWRVTDLESWVQSGCPELVNDPEFKTRGGS